MRYLRKKDGTIYVYTDALAKRGDMTECEAPVSAAPAIALEPSAPAGNPKPPTVDIYAITDKDELRRIGRELPTPVVFAGNPSLTNMQAKLAEVLGISAVVE